MRRYGISQSECLFQEYLYQKDKQGLAAVHYNFLQQQSADAERLSAQKKNTLIIFFIIAVSMIGALFIFGYRMKRAERAKRQAELEEQKKIISELHSSLKKETKVSRKLANETAYLNATRFLETMELNPKLVSRWTETDWHHIYLLIDSLGKGNIRTFLNNVEGLNEKEKRVFMLSILGLSPQQLGVIFSMKSVSISNLKLKIKQKIMLSNMADGLMEYAEQMSAVKGRRKY
jgi:DNA-binding CsgD family transcriptional regulator